MGIRTVVKVGEVVEQYGKQILDLDLGRRALAKWLSSELDEGVSEYFARQVLAELAHVDIEPEDTVEEKLRRVYGINDPSWVPVTIWGEPHDPRAKWERRFTEATAQWIADVVQRVGVTDYTEVSVADTDKPVAAVLSIRDSHFGMFTDFPGPYGKYDLDAAASEYRRAADQLLADAIAGGWVDHLIFPVGSDLLHVDGPDNATVKGTQQDVSTAWWAAFEKGLESVIAVVNMAEEYGFRRVTLVLEPGNHDGGLAKVLGYALAAKWSDSKLVDVLSGPESMKLVRVGGTRLFFHHGDSMKPEKYYGVLMSDYRKDMADATYVEVLSGHLHHRRKSVLQYAGDYQEDAGIVHRISPALCPASNWSEMSGYRSLPGAQLTIYDEDGFRALIEYRPQPG
ncbi:MAG: hypothetical protein LC687_02305 [Actinobacteria bacterium]|nr:hypothetical protein [Actinomycetota bacterium]